MGKVRCGYQNVDRDGRKVTSAGFLITSAEKKGIAQGQSTRIRHVAYL